jgi:hypothetical protein
MMTKNRERERKMEANHDRTKMEQKIWYLILVNKRKIGKRERK